MKQIAGEPSTDTVHEDDSMNDIPAEVSAKSSEDSVPFLSVLAKKNPILMPSKS